MKTTSNEGLPYAVDTDSSALPAEAQAFLLAQDARFPAWDAGFGLISKAAGFSARTTVNGTSINSGSLTQINWDTIDYDKGLTSLGSGIGSFSWNQQPGDGPSWWMFGVTVLWTLVSGTSAPTSNLSVVRIDVQDKDPNSPTGATLQNYNTGNADNTDAAIGRAIQVVTLARFRNDHSGVAKVFFAFRDTGASPVKRVTAGCRFWGFRVGSA